MRKRYTITTQRFDMDAGFNRVDYFDKNTIKIDFFINFLSNNKGLARIS